VLVLLLGAAAGYAGWWFASGRYSRVPELVGATQADAISRLEDAGYKVDVQPGPEYDANIKKGRVLRTDPEANTRLVRGQTVTIVISAGPHYYTLPSVTGKSFEAARAALQRAGPLTIAQDVKSEPSDTVPEGQVTRTDPKAGAKVTADQQVTIYVSTGPPVVDVPAIEQGTPYDTARRTLRQSDGKFKVEKVEEYSDSVAKGGVITISPADQATKFSTITVTVSKGPEFVTIPDFRPLAPLSDVQSALEGLGLHVTVDRPYGGQGDLVLAVDPPSGTSVRVGSPVTVTVY
jgi:serine/threonine-protein kinase